MAVDYDKLLSNLYTYLRKGDAQMRVKPSPKRTWILMLCLALTLTFLPGAAFAVDTYTTSDQCVEKIKEFEDLRLTAYTDISGKWYIGYGSNCDAGAYPNGISKEKAEELLRKDLTTAEDIVNGMLMQYGISVTQYQFDALVDMTYNLGRQWINPDYRLCSYLINGISRYSDVDVINAIATWCHAGGNLVMENLVTRRLWDAHLFLYGDYDNNGAEEYCYIDYEVNGGVNDARQNSRTVFYAVGLPYGDLPVPTKSGQSFLGWFDEDGNQLDAFDIVEGSKMVYARWGSGSDVSTPIPVQPTVDYSTWVNPYRDVKDTDWYYTYIRELSYHNITAGYPDGTFLPDVEISAGEALKLILLAATGAVDPGNAAYGHWAENYLALAEGLGCVYPNEIQNLDGAIDRATIARITAVAMGLELRTGVSPFEDTDDPYTLTLFEAGIIKGDIIDGHRYFSPNKGISRAEACAIVSGVRSYKPVNNPMTSGYIEYGNNRIPVMWNVPAAPYNKDLLVREDSIMHYYDPNYTTEIGIDVAVFQDEINWDKVAQSGMVSFAIIRIGARGWGSEGNLISDAQFERNLTEAQRVGLKTGVYYYSTAVTEEEAVEEALVVLQTLGGRALEYPVVYDWEIDSSKARNAKLDKATATRCAIAFCETIAQAGYTPMIYMGLETGYNRLDLSQLTGYDFWFAQYNSRNQPDMYYNYRIWQYTDSGSVPGIEGKVDMDIAFIPY